MTLQNGSRAVNRRLLPVLLAELFQTKPPTITLYLKSLYKGGALTEETILQDYLQVRTEGGSAVERQVEHHELGMKQPRSAEMPLRGEKSGTRFRKSLLTVFKQTPLLAHALLVPPRPLAEEGTLAPRSLCLGAVPGFRERTNTPEEQHPNSFYPDPNPTPQVLPRLGDHLVLRLCFYATDFVPIILFEQKVDAYGTHEKRDSDC
jgi:hypothetical protein